MQVMPLKILTPLLFSILFMNPLNASNTSDSLDHDEKVIVKSSTQKRDKKRRSFPLNLGRTRTPESADDFLQEDMRHISENLSKLNMKAEEAERRAPLKKHKTELTFWEVYVGIKQQNTSSTMPWLALEGPLLQRIITIGDLWQEQALDRTPTPDVVLFQVQQKRVKDSEENDVKTEKVEKIRVEYLLPLPYDNYTGEELLVAYFSAPQKKLKHATVHTTIKNVLAWQQGSDGTNLQALQRIVPLSSMPLTPHDPELRIFEGKKPEEFVRLQYNSEERSLAIFTYQFRPSELSTLLPHFPKDMVSLELENTNMRKKDAADLAPFLPDTLERINLARNKLSDMAFMSLSPAFRNGLKVIDLSGNRLGDVFLVTFAQNFPKTLEVFLIGSNAITNIGLKAFLSSLTIPLRKLDLTRTLINDDGMDAFSLSSHLPQELILSHTGVSDRGVEVLMNHDSKTLLFLHMDETRIGVDGKRILVEQDFTEAFPKFTPGLWMKQQKNTSGQNWMQ